MDVERLIRTWLLPICAALGFVTPAANAATTPATFSRADYPLLGNAVTAVDLNGDGRLDLAGAGAAVRVQLANGDGTFAPAVAYPVGPPAQDVVAGDFNGDGRMDLVASSASFPSGTVITLSVSNGRDAVWSGACSSGGDKVRSCTFTIRETAAVGVNVQ